MPWQDQFKGEKIYLANFQTAVIRAGSHSEEDLRELVTLHLQSGVKSTEHTHRCAGAQLPNCEVAPPHLGWVFPLGVTQLRKFLTDVLTGRSDLVSTSLRALPFPADFTVCQGDNLN